MPTAEQIRSVSAASSLNFREANPSGVANIGRSRGAASDALNTWRLLCWFSARAIKLRSVCSHDAASGYAVVMLQQPTELCDGELHGVHNTLALVPLG